MTLADAVIALVLWTMVILIITTIVIIAILVMDARR